MVLRDGGFLLAGISFSEPSGNKSAANYGYGDIWLVRIDAYGTKLWDWSYGGTDTDHIFGVLETADGFRIAGAMEGGTVTGGFWLANLDGAGNVVSERFWHFPIGGALGFRMFKPMPDGGFVLGASGGDYWIARLDASVARCFGSVRLEEWIAIP